MNNTNYSDESDTSDDDYVPSSAPAGGIPSEVDSDGDSEDPLSDSDVLSSKRTKRQKKLTKKKSKTTITTDTSSTSTSHENNSDQGKTIEDKKKHADDLWASFKKDTGFKKKDTNSTTTVKNPTLNETSEDLKPSPIVKPSETVKVTQIFEFAGEAVTIEKEVKADSVEARLHAQSSQTSTHEIGPPKRKAGLGGIGSVLSQIGKKQKLSTLEKSKLDWNKYKTQENITDELESYKKGKDGYLDKQDFLQRADLRQFEIEREVRTIERNKRFNNAP